MKSLKIINAVITLALTNFVSAKTSLSKCSSKITDKGYKCCSVDCVPSFTDEDGDWSIENGDWCGCGNNTNLDSFTGPDTNTNVNTFTDPETNANPSKPIIDSTNFDPFAVPDTNTNINTFNDPDSNANPGKYNRGISICTLKIIEKGYKCCPYKCEVIYTDSDGDWGVYNNEWCGCNPDYYVPANLPQDYKEMYEEFIRRYLAIDADDKEIEKKWLIDKSKIPYNLSAITVMEVEIKQTYICFDPEIRVREYTDGGEKSYEMTIKTNLTEDGLVRDETNIKINKEQYNNMVKKQEGNTIYKTRYQLVDNHEILAIDIFHGDLDGLAYLEVEFATKEESDAFKTPDWVIKDVTDDIRYKNGHLARYGIPDSQ